MIEALQMNYLFRFVLLVMMFCSAACAKPPDDDKGDNLDTEDSDFEILDTDPDSPVNSTDSNVVFDDDRFMTFEFVVDPVDWSFLNNHAEDEEYVPARLIYDGYDIGEVGLRYKGSVGTLALCFDEEGNQVCPKLSMKVKFSEYYEDKRFFGLKRLNFHALQADPSLMHDRLGYKLFRDMNVDAPRAVHARLVVNDEFIGVFSLVEQIDGRFTDNRFAPNGDGNLYKEIWPMSEDANYYESGLKTNEGEAEHSGMVSFADDLAGASDMSLPGVLETYADIDQLMRYLAVDRAISNWDGIMAWYTDGTFSGNHNYYWYQFEDQSHFQLIPWDLDNTFSIQNELNIVPAWNDLDAICDTTYSVFGGFAEVKPPVCDPLIRALALEDSAKYLTAVQELLEGPFNLDDMTDDISSWSSQISEAVAQDENGPGSLGWNTAVESLIYELSLLQLRLQKTADEVDVKPFGLDVDDVNSFETCDELEFALGALGASNSRSAFNFRLNSDDPLADTADARMSFEYRNETEDVENGGWSQWGLARLYFGDMETVALSTLGVTSIEFTASASSDRALRVDMESPLQSLGVYGVCFGWELNLTTEPQTFVIDLVDAEFPAWVIYLDEIPDEDLTDVIEAVDGFSFRPHAQGLNGYGLLPQGQTDLGWIQIDDISFI